MSQSRSKYLISQSLISSWQWSFRTDDGYDEFIKALRREKDPPNQAMLNGNRFEALVNKAAKGIEIDKAEKWYKPVRQLGKYLTGAQQQVKLYRDIEVGGVLLTCNGVLDFLRAGRIHDTKFSTTYHVGKYLDSPQHPMYFYLCPEAYEFEYLISDGTWVYHEVYRPDEVEPIDKTIAKFLDYLDFKGLMETYKANFISKI